MSKNGIIVLIITALVFTGLGFVIGQVVVAAGTNPGSEADPAVTQSYVDKLVGNYVTDLQTQIDELTAGMDELTGGAYSADAPLPAKTDDASGSDEPTVQHVKVSSDGVNVRSSASTGSVLTSVKSGDVLEYLGSETASDGEWYKVRLSDGTVGYIAGWLCGNPY